MSDRWLPALVLVLALGWLVSPFSTPLGACGPVLYDEGVLLGEALRISGRAPVRLRAPIRVTQMAMTRPLHTLLVAGAFRAVGARPWAGALVSVLCAALALGVFFALVQALGGTPLAWSSTLLLAGSNLFVHYAYTALAETPAILMLLGAMWALVRCRPAEFTGSPGDASAVPRAASFLVAGALAGLCLAANPRFVLAMPALGLVALAVQGAVPHARRLLPVAGALVSAFVTLAAALALLGWIEGTGAGLEPLFALGRHDSQYLLMPSRPDEYPVMLVVFEGPLLCGLAVHGFWLAVRRPGLLRWVAFAGPLLTLVLLTVGYGHHQLRYISMLLPWLALAAGVSLRSAMERMAWPFAIALAAMVWLALPFTRAPTPRGLPVAYAQTLDVLERAVGRLESPDRSPIIPMMVLASNFPVLQLLSDCRTARITFLPPLSVPSALRAAARAGVSHCVLDFERFFLGRFERGEVAPEVSRDALRRLAEPQVLPNPSAEGPYLWFEHGFTQAPADRSGFDTVEIYRLAAAVGGP